jgi:DNA polymerase
MGSYALQDLSIAGVRWELSETPIKSSSKKIPVQQTFQTNRTGTPIIIPPSAPITLDTVKSMVTRPNDIDSLLRMIGEFNHPLRNGATNVVMPNIATKPNGLVIITDLPSSDDDLSGKILSGNAGEMVDKMLSAIDMSRENVSIIPLIFWRTPGGRTPNREELDLSMPFIDKMLEMLKPRIVITFGTLAANEIAKTNLTSAHGNEIESDQGYTIIPIYHPNYLILKPSAKKDVWDALQNIQKLLKNQ